MKGRTKSCAVPSSWLLAFVFCLLFSLPTRRCLVVLFRTGFGNRLITGMECSYGHSRGESRRSGPLQVSLSLTRPLSLFLSFCGPRSLLTVSLP